MIERTAGLPGFQGVDGFLDQASLISTPLSSTASLISTPLSSTASPSSHSLNDILDPSALLKLRPQLSSSSPSAPGIAGLGFRVCGLGFREVGSINHLSSPRRLPQHQLLPLLPLLHLPRHPCSFLRIVVTLLALCTHTHTHTRTHAHTLSSWTR